MTYFNPKIYNYSNLNKEDREHFFWMYYMYEIVLNFNNSYNDENNHSVLEKMYNEIENEVIESIGAEMRNDLIVFIVTRIDGYDYEVDMVDTDDYFYGLKTVYTQNDIK